MSGQAFQFRSEGEGDEAPTSLVEVDDRLRADEALTRVRRGEALRYVGTFQNARQLLTAMARRLPSGPPPTSALEAFRAERRARQLEAQTLSRVMVGLDRSYRLLLKNPPDVATACRQVWGDSEADLTVVPLKTLLGMLGAAEWRRKGLVVPSLKGRLTPHYGVYVPTRHEYVELLTRVPDVAGQSVFDLGTGTGVLSFLLLQRGAAQVVATDVEPRAVACATENARALKLADRFTVLLQPLFPEGLADLIVCNPPWLPEPAKNRFDRAVFDEQSGFLLGFLDGLKHHLTPGGRGLLVLSDLAELLGLRALGWLEAQLHERGLTIDARWSTPARHGKAFDSTDPLHHARSRERTTLFQLRAR